MFLLQWVGVVAEHSLRLSRVQHIVRYPGLLSTVPILIPVQLCPRDIFRTVIEVMVEVCVVFYMFLYGWPVSTDSTKNKHSVGSDETIIYYFGAWWVKDMILDSGSPPAETGWAQTIIKLRGITFYLIL